MWKCRSTTVRAAATATLAPRRQQDAVDDVDHAVAGGHVRRDYPRAVDHDRAPVAAILTKSPLTVLAELSFTTSADPIRPATTW